MDSSLPFHKQYIVLANGIAGRVAEINSFNPVNYEGIVSGELGEAVTLHAQLFVPKPITINFDHAHAAVIIIPGSGGVNDAMLVHAEKLTDTGIAALVLDPFAGRNVENTISVQQQFSFAASTYDVFACMKFLSTQNDIDANRLGAMGYSRGGLAVIQAAISHLAKPALGNLAPLCAVFAGWPWCGYQFITPNMGHTVLRLIAADHDDWASVVQSQAYFSAIRARSPFAELRIMRDAQHGFGYGTPENKFPDAMKALQAPVVYFNEQGVMLDVWSGEPMPGLDDKAIISLLASHISRGVTVGSKEGQMADFMQDMTTFFAKELLQ
jgi:dienelactone hydrolase